MGHKRRHTGGWVNVSLTDTNFYSLDCLYRARLSTNGDYNSRFNIDPYFFSTFISAKTLAAPVATGVGYIPYDNKSAWFYNGSNTGVTVVLVEKKCE